MPRTRRIVVAGIGSPVIEAGPQDAREAVVFVHGNPAAGVDPALGVAPRDAEGQPQGAAGGVR
jgi:hypothetical protein